MNSISAWLENKLAAPLVHFTERIKLWHVLLLSLVIAAGSIAYHHGACCRTSWETRPAFLPV